MTEDAAAEAGVSSPVGFRWFRHAGGVNPCLAPTVSGRYLSFSEREDIALLRRIQQLTAEGHNLEGVRRILELEAENERLRHELARLQQQYRRDLVPFKDSPTHFRPNQ